MSFVGAVSLLTTPSQRSAPSIADGWVAPWRGWPSRITAGSQFPAEHQNRDGATVPVVGQCEITALQFVATQRPTSTDARRRTVMHPFEIELLESRFSGACGPCHRTCHRRDSRRSGGTHPNFMSGRSGWSRQRLPRRASASALSAGLPASSGLVPSQSAIGSSRPRLTRVSCRGCGPGYLVGAGSRVARAWGSSDREATPSFGYTWYRCAPTVRCDRNKRSAISRLESPDAAICAI
jgi:hypothetical protein